MTRFGKQTFEPKITETSQAPETARAHQQSESKRIQIRNREHNRKQREPITCDLIDQLEN